MVKIKWPPGVRVNKFNAFLHPENPGPCFQGRIGWNYRENSLGYALDPWSMYLVYFFTRNEILPDKKNEFLYWLNIPNENEDGSQ